MEVWKEVKDYEGLYKVSDLGNVFSLISNKLLKPTLSKTANGYRRYVIRLTKDKKSKLFLIHQLVCRNFNGEMPHPDMEVRHIDGDSLNNEAINLAWGTHGDNIRDKATHGTEGYGEKNSQAILSDEDIALIRSRYVRGNQKALAKEYGVSQSQISRIINGKRWSKKQLKLPLANQEKNS